MGIDQYGWVSARNLSRLMQKLSKTLIPLYLPLQDAMRMRSTLRSVADAPTLGDATASLMRLCGSFFLNFG
jgi:hypothetical protein